MKHVVTTAILLVTAFFARAQSGPQIPDLVVKEDEQKQHLNFH
jgi:hypothetical protein